MVRKTGVWLLILLMLLLSFASCAELRALLGETEPSGVSGAADGSETEQTADEGGRVKYTKLFKESRAASLPLMPTDFDGVFYTMNTAGEVKFYILMDGIPVEKPTDGVYNASVRCSGQNIPVSIYYTSVDGRVNGFGLFTYSEGTDVMLFDYAFFKLCELPAAFREEGKLLLLVDTDKTRFYKDKVYSEEFYFDTTDLSTSYFLSEDQRQTGMDGLKMTDYKMFTDEMLAQPYDDFYFFTSRAYISEDNKLVDIYTSGGYGTNVDNIRVIRNMLGMYFYRSDAGVYYYSAEDTGFSIYLYDGSAYTLVRSFTGDFETGYLRSGSAILEKATGVIYDIAAGAEYTVDYSALGGGFVPVNFVMNGQYACVTGDDSAGNLLIGLLDTQKGLTVATGFQNRNMLRFYITANGTLLISVCYESDYTSYQLLCPMGER